MPPRLFFPRSRRRVTQNGTQSALLQPRRTTAKRLATAHLCPALRNPLYRAGLFAPHCPACRDDLSSASRHGGSGLCKSSTFAAAGADCRLALLLAPRGLALARARFVDASILVQRFHRWLADR